MNIDEERKAFEAAIQANSFNAKWVCTQYQGREAMFELWQAAKVHAEEMRKPVVRVAAGNGGYEVWDSFNERLGIGETREESVKWAAEQGYRVLE